MFVHGVIQKNLIEFVVIAQQMHVMVGIILV